MSVFGRTDRAAAAVGAGSGERSRAPDAMRGSGTEPDVAATVGDVRPGEVARRRG